MTEITWEKRDEDNWVAFDNGMLVGNVWRAPSAMTYRSSLVDGSYRMHPTLNAAKAWVEEAPRP